MLLNPSIRVGGLIHLDNSRIAEYGFQAAAGAKRDGGKAEAEVDRSEQRKISSDGYYYVMVVEHRGNTRGGDWYTDVLCVATDATLYPRSRQAGPGGGDGKAANVVK